MRLVDTAPSNRRAVARLADLGLPRSAATDTRFGFSVALIAAVAGGTWQLVGTIVPTADPVQAVGVVVATGAFLLGLQQWRSTRYENSLEKLYDRLELANRRLDDWEAARRVVPHFWTGGQEEDAYRVAMYVYIELDNLEYVIEKYARGYMEPLDALRGIAGFESRCGSAVFRKLAVEQAHVAGYKARTREVVERICRDCEAAEPQAPQPPHNPDRGLPAKP